jgi:hypothetical protein
MHSMIEGQSHFQPFGLPCWGSENLSKEVGSMTASYDYQFAVDYHKSYSHLVVQDSAGKTLRSGRVKNDRKPLGGFLERYRENSGQQVAALGFRRGGGTCDRYRSTAARPIRASR